MGGMGTASPGMGGMGTASPGMGGMGTASPGMGGMGSGSSSGRAPTGMAGPTSTDPIDSFDRWRQPTATVPLGELADIDVVTGPPMIKDEDGVLVGYVFADIDTSKRDLGGWVDDAKLLVAERLSLPPGYGLAWTGQYEFMTDMQDRMKIVVPLTLALIVVLLYMSVGGWQQTLLVLACLPFALAGSFLLLWSLNYNLSTATWVGLIAVGGVAAQTGIVMIVYLDDAFVQARERGQIVAPADVDGVIVECAAARARPLVMTVATTVLGLSPLLWETGVGADVSARTAAPVVGGLWSCMFLTLLTIPAAYAIWRRWQVRAAAKRGEA
jgi:Cu(I)/Ag(I) efflux system membrane protein CusA/SilA